LVPLRSRPCPRGGAVRGRPRVSFSFSNHLGSKNILDSLEEVAMVAGALKKLKTFHATMQVMRTEEWCVEAETPEQARALLAAGSGHRCAAGECMQAELVALHDQSS